LLVLLGKLDGDILLSEEMLNRLKNPTDPDTQHETRNILRDSKYLMARWNRSLCL
jgi:hypothetical protein